MEREGVWEESVTERERKKSERERVRKELERERELTSQLQESRPDWRGGELVLQPGKTRQIFFWFSVDQFEFSVDSHFLTLPNTGKLVKPFTENGLRRNKRISL